MATTSATAQAKQTHKKNRPRGKSNEASVGINLPVGDFFNTHIVGAGAEYTRSNHRFGILESMPSSAFGFIYTGGIDYYHGKKEKTPSYTYSYPGFSLLHIYGGAIYNLCRKGSISLTTGPALGLYNGRTQFWWGVNMSGSYYFNEKVAIAPGIIFMKQSGAEVIGSATIRVLMAF